MRRIHGGVDIPRIALRDLGPRLPGIGVIAFKGFLRGAVAPLVADKYLILFQIVFHVELLPLVGFYIGGPEAGALETLGRRSMSSGPPP